MKANAMNGARKGERRYERAIDWLLDQLNDPRTPMDTKIKIALALVKIQEACGRRKETASETRGAGGGSKWPIRRAERAHSTRRGVLVMRPVRDDGTNVPATVATTGTRVAKVDREREVPTLGDALVMLGSTLQQNFAANAGRRCVGRS